jgi:hypothetical protein
MKNFPLRAFLLLCCSTPLVLAQISIPAGKPGNIAFSADLTVKTTRRGEYGATSQTDTGRYFRDRLGRTRQDTAAGSTIVDATTRTVITLNHSQKEAVVTIVPLPAPQANQSSDPTTLPRQEGGARAPVAGKAEDLGEATLGGQRAFGRRVISPNPFGTKVGSVTTEVWTVPEIGLTVLMKQTSPAGETEQRYDNIRLGEPDSNLFVIPNNYSVRNSIPATRGEGRR